MSTPRHIAALREIISAEAPVSDGDLLDRFRAGDRDAFGELVRRHAALVAGVCRRGLPDPNDADDAFQTTFLALARDAGKVRSTGTVAGWLFGVARRVTQRMRRDAARRRHRERNPVRCAGGSAPELAAMLDEEVGKLPERLRGPVLLCYYQGQTRDRAASVLGLSLRTVERRLNRARALLKDRLQRRGVSLGAAGLAGLSLTGPVAAALIRRVIISAIPVSSVPYPPWTRRTFLAAGVLTVGGLAAGRAFRGDDPPSPTAGDEGPRLRGPSFTYGDLRFRYGPGVSSAAFSPDGKLLATLGERGAALFDAADGRLIRAWPSARNWLYPLGGIAFSPDGRTLAIDGELHNTGTGEIIRRHAGHCPVFSPDGSYLALVGNDQRTVKVFDSRTGDKIREYGFEGVRSVRSLAAVPRSSRLAIVIASGQMWPQLVVRDMPSGEAVPIFSQEQPECVCPHPAFSPDGKSILLDDQGVRIRDLRTGIALAAVHGGCKSSAFSPNGKLASLVTSRNSLWLINTANGESRWESDLEVVDRVEDHGTTFSPDGKSVVVHSHRQCRVRFWVVATGERRFHGEDHAVPVTQLAVSRDGRTLISADTEEIVIHRRIPDGRIIRRSDWDESESLIRDPWAFSPDGSRIVTGYGYDGRTTPDRAFREFDSRTGKFLGNYANQLEQEGRVNALALSEDGRRLIAMLEGRHLSVFDATNRAYLRTISFPELPPGFSTFQMLAISGDGSVAAVPGVDQVFLWDTGTGERQPPPPRLGFQAYHVSLSPDGNWLAVSGGTHSIVPGGKFTPRQILWDRKRGRVIPLGIAAHPYRQHMRFSPDGAVLAFAYDPDRIDLFEVASGRTLARLGGARGGVTSLAFSPDGRTLYAGTGSSAVFAWDIDGD